MANKRIFLIIFLCSLPLASLAQYRGGFSMNDNVYAAFRMVNGEPELDEIQIRQISLGNEIQVYMDAKTAQYLDGTYLIDLPGGSGPIGTMNISKGLLHGECLLHYRRTLDKKMMYNRGLLHGETLMYHEDGSRRGVIKYVKGKAQYAINYHRVNGQIKEEIAFNEQGRIDGQVLTRDAGGKIVAEINYCQGKYHGRKMAYNDAREQEIKSYDMGTLSGEYKLIDPEGATKLEGWYDKESKRTGRWTYYSEDGSTNKIEHYLKGELHGAMTLYYPKEVIKLEEEYQYGKLNGKRVEYAEAPYHKVSEGNYKDNRLDGEFKAYNKGELWRDCMYRDGKMIREKQYLNGKVQVLRMIDDRDNLVDVRKYDQAGKTTYRNQSYKKPNSLRLVEDASGIIDIE